jgi:hypothetical protein
MKELIEWLENLDPDKVEPFTLASGRHVHNPGWYIGAMREQIQKGPDSIHARLVAIDLKELWESLNSRPKLPKGINLGAVRLHDRGSSGARDALKPNKEKA